MNTEELARQAAAAGGADMPAPVATWGSKLSPAAQSFFDGGYMQTNESVDVMAKYFSELLRTPDPNNLKAGLVTMYFVVRHSSRFYLPLATPEIVTYLMQLTQSRDTHTADKSAAMLTGLMARYPMKFSDAQVRDACGYNGSELGKLDALSNLLKYDGFREGVWATNYQRVYSGLNSSNVPTLYKGLMCVWLSSFNTKVLNVMDPATVIGGINNVLSSNRTEKVVRMCLQSVTNLLASKKMSECMAEMDTVTVVSALEYEKWRDAELIDSIKELITKLNAEVKLLTNFERFEREVNSGVLKWGFIHSDKFWNENVLKCDKTNFVVVDKLMTIASNSSSNAESLAVACHDLGEFARLHPVGKQIAMQKGAKDRMLQLMSDPQRDVAREALLCVQKIMLSKSYDQVAATVAA